MNVEYCDYPTGDCVAAKEQRMSMQKKLDEAYLRGKIEECARVLWIMDDERAQLRRGLEKVVLVEAQRHAMQTKIKLAVAIFEKLKFRIMAGDKPPGGGRPTKETNGHKKEEGPEHEGPDDQHPSRV